MGGPRKPSRPLSKSFAVSTDAPGAAGPQDELPPNAQEEELSPKDVFEEPEKPYSEEKVFNFIDHLIHSLHQAGGRVYRHLPHGGQSVTA